jgi:hypothetical protein
VSILFNNAVLLLVHRRLNELVDALDRKEFSLHQQTPPAELPDPDARVRALARAALTMIEEAGDPIDVPPGARLGRHARFDGSLSRVGKYAIFGTAGFELPVFVDYFSPRQGWLVELLRRGSPDPNLSRVVASGTDFILRFADHATEHPISGFGYGEDVKKLTRGFSMGMFAALAGEVVTSPLLQDLHSRRVQLEEWTRYAPADVIAASESLIRRDLLGGIGADKYQSWWPTTPLPSALLDSYLGTLEELLHLHTPADRTRGFADFEQSFTPGEQLTADKLANSYAVFRMAIGSGWSGPAWWFFLLMFTLPALSSLLISAFTGKSKLIFDGSGQANEESVFQLVTLPLLIGGVFPFLHSSILAGVLPGGETPWSEVFIAFLARAGLAVAYGFSYAAAEDGQSWDAGVRWGLIFLPLILGDVYFTIRAIIDDNNHRRGSAMVRWLHLTPFLTALFCGWWGVCFNSWGATTDGAGFVIAFVIVAVLTLLVQIAPAISLANAGNPIAVLFDDKRGRLPILDALASPDEAAARRALARVYDDTTLWRSGEGGATPGLAHLKYPSGGRVLVKMHWTGSGDLEVKHDGNQLTFKLGGNEQVITLPPTVTTAMALASYLHTHVLDSDNAANKLFAEPFLATDTAGLPAGSTPVATGAELPYPQMLAREVQFKSVSSSSDDPYLLRHAARIDLTSRLGQRQATHDPLEGYRLAPGSALGDAEATGLGNAADLATLLCMAGAQRIVDPVFGLSVPAPPSPNVPVTAVRQVFRQWNLDERRMNEWRMLISGNAHSDKPANPATADTATVTSGAGYAAGPATGEQVANSMGWVNLLRAWSRVAADPDETTTSGAVTNYTPRVKLGGVPQRPSNTQLTEALRFLLDLP